MRRGITTAIGLLLLLATPAASAEEPGWARQALGLQYELASDVELRNAPWVYTHNSYNSEAEMGTTLSNRDSNQAIAILDQLDEGVRSLEIDTHLFTSPQDPRVGPRGPVVCHARGESEGHAAAPPRSHWSWCCARCAAGWIATRARCSCSTSSRTSSRPRATRRAPTRSKKRLAVSSTAPRGRERCEKLPLDLTRDEVRPPASRS